MNFISFSCLIALARASSTVLNKSGKSQHRCLVPDLRAKAFSIKYDTSCNDSVLLEIDFLICSLGEISLTAGALGTDWWKEAGDLTSQYVEDATSPFRKFLSA